MPSSQRFFILDFSKNELCDSVLAFSGQGGCCVKGNGSLKPGTRRASSVKQLLVALPV